MIVKNPDEVRTLEEIDVNPSMTDAEKTAIIKSIQTESPIYPRSLEYQDLHSMILERTQFETMQTRLDLLAVLESNTTDRLNEPKEDKDIAPEAFVAPEPLREAA